jgi:hypothetical protein
MRRCCSPSSSSIAPTGRRGSTSGPTIRLIPTGYNGPMNRGPESFDSPERETLEMLRSKTAAERVEIAFGMWR